MLLLIATFYFGLDPLWAVAGLYWHLAFYFDELPRPTGAIVWRYSPVADLKF
jgi:hypothetical protein